MECPDGPDLSYLEAREGGLCISHRPVRYIEGTWAPEVSVANTQSPRSEYSIQKERT